MKVRTEADAVLAIRLRMEDERRMAAIHEEALWEDWERSLQGPPHIKTWDEIIAGVPEGYCDSYVPASSMHADGDGDLSTFGQPMRRGD